MWTGRTMSRADPDEKLMGEMPLLRQQETVVRFIHHAKGHGKHCARSAVSHLHQAWALRTVDQEMAVLRAFTSEEEAASAVFHAIKRRKYRGADQLDQRSHIHKVAVRPFFQAVSEALSKVNVLEPMIEFDESEAIPRILTRFTAPGPDGSLAWVSPEPPLHFGLSDGKLPYDFTRELERGCRIRGVKSSLDYVRKRANRRNQLLYASVHGVPKFAGDLERLVLEERDTTFNSLMVFLLIDQYPEKQGFVQQCLVAFLKMLKRLPHGLESESE